MNQEPNSEAAETVQTTDSPAVDLPRLVRQFDFQTGTPPESGWYLVELDQPGLINTKPFDVDMCRLRKDSEGRMKADWAYWYDHNIRRWAILPRTSKVTDRPTLNLTEHHNATATKNRR